MPDPDPPTHCARRRGGGRATPALPFGPDARRSAASCGADRFAPQPAIAPCVFSRTAPRLLPVPPTSRRPRPASAAAWHAAGRRRARRGRPSVSAPRARALAAPLPLDAPPAREPDQREARAVMDGLRAWPNPFSAERTLPKPKKKGGLRPLSGRPPAGAAPAPNALSGLRTGRPASWARGRRRSRRTARPQAARPCPRSATASCAWTRRLSTGRPRRSWFPRRRELLRGNR